MVAIQRKMTDCVTNKSHRCLVPRISGRDFLRRACINFGQIPKDTVDCSMAYEDDGAMICKAFGVAAAATIDSPTSILGRQ